MKVKYKFLFNFSVSRTGGGLKRLCVYAKWFHEKGGAYFIIHPNCDFLTKEFPNNKYFVVIQGRIQRVFNDCYYLTDIKKKIGEPDLFYSYGIPIYYRFGKINWFHLSNILPLRAEGMGLTLFDRYIRFNLLGRRIINNYENADIVSAESQTSLNLIKIQNRNKAFLSLNGSDDEIDCLNNQFIMRKENIAVAVGTQRYKALMDVYSIFKFLKKQNKFLKLLLVGSKDTIPKKMINNDSVILTGVIKQCDVIELLKKSKYYISATKVENSFNAASEGIVFAEESFISDIGPHRELLEGELYDVVSIPNVANRTLKVKRKDIQGKNMMLWNDIILEVIDKSVELQLSFLK